MSTLNEKIKKIIEGSVYTDYFFNGEDEIPFDYVDKGEAAFFLEILVIQEKIDMVKGWAKEVKGYREYQSANYLEEKIEQLTQQLKQLQP